MRTRRPSAGPAAQRMEGLHQNMPLFLLAALFIAGSLCGMGLYGALSPSSAKTLMFLLSGTGTQTKFQFWSVFVSVFLSNFSVLAVLFLCGFCAVSQPVILLLPFIKGLGFGLVAAYNTVLLSPYSAFFWLKFLPGAFLATTLILLCAKQSFSLSLHVFRSVFSVPPKENRFLPASYGMRYLFLAAVCVVFSLIDAVFDMIYEIVSTA